MTGKAEWKTPGISRLQSETTVQRVRNILPVKINEVRFNNQFIELFNASAKPVDLSNWPRVRAQSQWAPVRLATIPAGTQRAAGAYYLLGLSASGLATPASPGSTTISVRSIAGFTAGQKIQIEGEERTITNAGSAAASMTTLFIPVSTGPWITFPAGSTNLPVTSANSFKVGEKIGIDIGGNYEVATVTAVGTAATQTTLSTPAVAGTNNISPAATAGVTAGDTLTIGTGARRETVKVTNVGASGITLATPLRFDNMSGVDVSDPGTGITFSPATRFAHQSGDAVQALGSGITLDRPLVNGHAYGAPVVNPDAATGYQGPPAPNQWFGGALSTAAGSIPLLDSGGLAVVDAMVYGSQQSNSSGNGTIASPELATLEGDQGKGGCLVVVPPGAGTSVGRFPDGFDADRNCTDFRAQPASTLAAPSTAGASNIKALAVSGFAAGQTISIDSGASQETAVIATVGTSGATTASAATAPGATVIPVANGFGFSTGQTITIDTGANLETAVIASASRRPGRAAITVTAPLTLAHADGAQVSGTGITLSTGLSRAHPVGAPLATDLPTLGAPNKY